MEYKVKADIKEVDLKVSKKEIAKSRAEAFAKVCSLLDDLEGTQKRLDEKTIGTLGHNEVAYWGNKNDIGYETAFTVWEKDSYSIMVRNLFFEKEHKYYNNLEYGLIKFAMNILPRNKQKVREFYEKYVVRHNNRLKEKR